MSRAESVVGVVSRSVASFIANSMAEAAEEAEDQAEEAEEEEDQAEEEPMRPHHLSSVID